MKPNNILGGSTPSMLEVPYLSQWDTTIPEEWRKRACGIVSLRMALGAVVPDAELPPVNELIEEGVQSGAYREGIGWTHDGLVALANKYGAYAHRDEYKQDTFEVGATALAHTINQGGVPIISVMIEGKTDTHLVPLVGYGEEAGQGGFYYHEPAAEPGTPDAQRRFIALPDLDKRWRRLAIHVCPPKVEVR